MKRTYETPIIVANHNLAEGVYLASGQKTGSLDVSYFGTMDKWNGGGKGVAQISWSGIDGTVSLSITFNDTIDDVEATGASVQKSFSGKTVHLTFSGAETGTISLGVHLNHGTSIDDLNIIDYDYTVS